LPPGAYSGFYLRFGAEIDPEANARVHAVAALLLKDPYPGVTDIIPGYVTLYIEFDASRVSERAVRRWAAAHRKAAAEASLGRRVKIPVCYDGEDLAEVARRTGLSREEVILRHSDPLYRVYAVGFTPGFPFLGLLDEGLRLPRRQAPRPTVPAHSVAIAGTQTGIYPMPSPGGWHLLGRALTAVYEPHRNPPFLLAPGDEVRFVPGEGARLAEPQGLELLPATPRHPLFAVVKPGLLDLVIDRGRFMAGRFGLARSGPVDSRSAALANALVGNAPEAPLLEFNLQGPTLKALTGGIAAFAGFGLRPICNGEALAPFASFVFGKGDVLKFEPDAVGSRGYLALAGGLESATFYGSASVDLRGRIGRPLGEGDVLGLAAATQVRAGRVFVPYTRPRGLEVLRLVKGPQYDPETLTALSSGTFVVQTADRMGVRLAGPPVPGGGDIVSEAVPIGAVQVPADGAPIILLNDRGTLGGYRKPALVHPADLPRLGQLRPKQTLRFSLTPAFNRHEAQPDPLNR
jgi:KipI family sensor histidine kinase inhibitor